MTTPTARQIYTARPSREEIDEVLGQRLTATLGTLNDDGSIHLTYLIYAFLDGRFLVETASLTRKARNVEARGTASVLVQGRAASTARNLMVAAEGTARLLLGDEANAANHLVRAKYIVDDAVEALDASWNAFDDVAIEIVPERWRSWTGDALAKRTEADTGRDYGDLWKPD